MIAAAVVAFVLAGGYFLVDMAWRSKHETTASTTVISDKSIAVLPFVDMSEKKDQEYFGDGMAEDPRPTSQNSGSECHWPYVVFSIQR